VLVAGSPEPDAQKQRRWHQGPPSRPQRSAEGWRRRTDGGRRAGGPRV